MRIHVILVVVFYAAFMEARSEEAAPLRSDSASLNVTLYDPDPEHLWNRLYSVLFLRKGANGKVYGKDSLDSLFFNEMNHLRTEPSVRSALIVLDEFINSQGEKLIKDPVKRAVMQRDLWAAVESNASIAKDIQTRISTVIGRIALTKSQIQNLPDNYASALNSKYFESFPTAGREDIPFLPTDLFQTDSPWICLGLKADFMDGGEHRIDKPLADVHISHVRERSAFLVFLRFPEGRSAAIAYLKRLKRFKTPYVPDPNPPAEERAANFAMPNPAAPQVPLGTMVALVRQMLVIDDHGKVTPTHLVESVQIRAFRRIVESHTDFPARVGADDVYEFILSREKLFQGASGGLRARGITERDFLAALNDNFINDPMEYPRPMDRASQVMVSCRGCHRSEGVYSILSLSDLASDQWADSANFKAMGVSTPKAERQKVANLKEDSDDFRQRFGPHHGSPAGAQ